MLIVSGGAPWAKITRLDNESLKRITSHNAYHQHENIYCSFLIYSSSPVRTAVSKKAPLVPVFPSCPYLDLYSITALPYQIRPKGNQGKKITISLVRSVPKTHFGPFPL